MYQMQGGVDVAHSIASMLDNLGISNNINIGLNSGINITLNG